MSEQRIIALNAEQRWSRGGVWSGYILMTADEAEKLEKALRLARTGKLGKERPVITRTADPDFHGNWVKSTKFIVKGYVPRKTP